MHSKTGYPTLYKYRSLSGRGREITEDIIENSRLWYSKASAFNDPFDCNLMITGKGQGEWEQMFGRAIEVLGESVRSKTIASIEAHGGEIPWLLKPAEQETNGRAGGWKMTIEDEDGDLRDVTDFFNDLQARRLSEMHDTLDRSFGVLSLSEKPDDILMWSHYADRHSGICLEFNPAAHPSAFPRLSPVRYKEQYPYISAHFPDFLKMMRQDRKMKQKSVYQLLLETAHVLAGSLDEAQDEDETRAAALSVARWFYVKASHWAYEREWRALSGGPGLFPFTKRALKGIIVGCVNSEENLDWARKITKDRRPRIRLYKAVKKEREFGLKILPVA